MPWTFSAFEWSLVKQFKCEHISVTILDLALNVKTIWIWFRRNMDTVKYLYVGKDVVLPSLGTLHTLNLSICVRFLQISLFRREQFWLTAGSLNLTSNSFRTKSPVDWAYVICLWPIFVNQQFQMDVGFFIQAATAMSILMSQLMYDEELSPS